MYKLLRSQTDRKSGKTFQLINCTSRMPQPSAGHFCHRDADRRGQRGQYKRSLVPHAAGAVFVYLNALYAGKIQHVSAVRHSQCELFRLFRSHACKTDRHHHGRHLIIRYLSVCIFPDHPLYFFF